MILSNKSCMEGMKSFDMFCSLAVLDPRVGRTMDVLSPFISALCHFDWFFPGVLSTYWCCPSRPCVVFLACVHLALFLALSVSPDNSLVFSWCDHASFLALTVSNSSLFTLALLRAHSFVFFAVNETHRIFLGPFISKASRSVSSFFLSVQLSQPYVAAGHTSTFISRIFVEICMLWLFHIFCSDAPIAFFTFNLVRNFVVHSPSSVITEPRPRASRIHLLHLLILNEYAACYAVAHHYLGLVDVHSIKTSQHVQHELQTSYRMLRNAVVVASSCRQAMKMEPVHGVMLSSTELCAIDHVHLQNHRPKENCIPTASELYGVCTSVMWPIPTETFFTFFVPLAHWDEND